MPNEEALRLLAAHRRGDLTEAERTQLADFLLADQDLFDAFAAEQLLANALEDKTFRHHVMDALGSRDAGWKAFRLNWMGQVRRGGWVLTGATVGILAISVSAVLFFLHRQTKSDVAGLRRPEIQEGHNQKPKTGQGVDGKTASMAASRTSATNKTTQGPLRIPVSPGSSDSVLGVLLVPSIRSEGAGNVIKPTRATKGIRLESEVSVNSFAEYSIAIQTSEGRPIRDWTGVKPEPLPGGKARVSIEVPASVLPSGDYVLYLYGVGPDSKKELVDGLSFLIVGAR
jgi:hypothetical protein